MYRAILNSMPEPIKTAENAQIPNTAAFTTSKKMYLSKILMCNKSRSRQKIILHVVENQNRGFVKTFGAAALGAFQLEPAVVGNRRRN